MNIHGAVNLENFDAPFVEVNKVTGESSVALLEKIEARNPDKDTIYVIWDNAAYHKCDKVKTWLARDECRIHLIRLPCYPQQQQVVQIWINLLILLPRKPTIHHFNSVRR